VAASEAAEAREVILRPDWGFYGRGVALRTGDGAASHREDDTDPASPRDTPSCASLYMQSRHLRRQPHPYAAPYSRLRRRQSRTRRPCHKHRSSGNPFGRRCIGYRTTAATGATALAVVAELACFARIAAAAAVLCIASEIDASAVAHRLAIRTGAIALHARLARSTCSVAGPAVVNP
jgi:hypothetical protein